MHNAELDSLIEEARRDIISVGLPMPARSRFDYEIKTMRAWGKCHYRRYSDGYRFRITLSTFLMSCDHQAKINTLTHEFIHACFPGDGHGSMFKFACARLNNRYPDKYDLARTTAAEKKMDVEHAKALYKHIIACPKCGKFYGFMRSCESLNCLHTCSNCHTLMEQVK